MRTGISAFVDDMAGDAGHMNVQDSIIVASLDSISGKHCLQIKNLFVHAGIFAGIAHLQQLTACATHMMLLLPSCLYFFVFAEDQRIPAAVFGVLFTATQDAPTSASSLERKPSVMMLKRWLSILVKRSLFLELVRGSIYLHGIAPSNHTLITSCMCITSTYFAMCCGCCGLAHSDIGE